MPRRRHPVRFCKCRRLQVVAQVVGHDVNGRPVTRPTCSRCRRPLNPLAGPYGGTPQLEGWTC
jgi:hypothetical protein